MSYPHQALNPVEKKIYRLAERYLLTVRQDDLHVANALDFAFRLLETASGDRDVVIPALILHDTGWSEIPEDMMARAFGPAADVSLTRAHEQAGARIAAEVLMQVGYNGEKAAEILQIIDGHDTRQVPVSLNDKIIKDSDKLTRYAKCFPVFARVLGLTLPEYASILKSYGEHWFHLPVSREMARTALRDYWQFEW